MKSIVFLSHLHDEDERGGAFLRNDALTKIFSSWGYDVSPFYRGQFSLISQRLKKFIMGLRFGSEIRSLFTKANFNVPPCEILIIDNFKYLSWNYHFSGKRPLIIYNGHNLEFENHFGKSSSRKKDKFAFYEASRLKSMDIILLCSDRERELLLSIDPLLTDKVLVFPNLIDINRFSQCHQRLILKGFNGTKRLISFVGSLNYFPNIEAVKFLGSEVFPKLSPELKSRFVVAGRRPSQEVIDICAEHAIELRLDLSENEMTQLFLETKVLVVPLEHGSGTRLKIIEGVLSDCSILSTDIGTEGIESEMITTADLGNFSSELVRMCDQIPDRPLSVNPDPVFLNSYELSAWAKSNRELVLSFIEEKAL